MTLPTEPIGSIPRPQVLIDGMQAAADGRISPEQLNALYDDAVQDTLRRFEETGSPVVTDGEQRKPSFATYPVAGLPGLAGGGVTIPFEDGHTRQLPVLTTAPFRYATYAWSYLDGARGYTSAQLKQAVISASAISLMYPADGIAGYPLGAFVDLNNRVLDGLTDEERSRVGVHSCPGGDQDSTHSADVDYRELLPALCRMNVGSFYVQLASEADREPALRILGKRGGSRRIFVGVTDPIDRRIETPEEVRDRVLEAARFIDPSHLGTTDDCGFSPFGDDSSTSRDTAFAKIRARVNGTAMAARVLGV
jgi:5-methyltetrahydropteroyltriglutamate--homocysteine methyltransferase